MATLTSYCSSARTGEMNSASRGGEVPKCVRMRSTTDAGAVGPAGDGGGGGGSLGCSASSHLGRPRSVSPPETYCLGPRTFSSCPTKVKLGDLGGAGSTASRSPNTIGETEVAVGGRLGETGSDGTVGKSGAEPRSGGVCVCVSLVCVGCAALLEQRGEALEGGSQLAVLAPRECRSSPVCRDLVGFDGRGVARVR